MTFPSRAICTDNLARPGKLPWLVGEELRKNGVAIVNAEMTGETHRDRYLLTGDSPLASNNLGRMAAEALLEDVAKRD